MSPCCVILIQLSSWKSDPSTLKLPPTVKFCPALLMVNSPFSGHPERRNCQLPANLLQGFHLQGC
jgi:hypothetical protein